LKFLIDMPVTPDAGPHLRAAGHDAVHAVDLGLARSSDNELLTVARREERVIITADLDYPRLIGLQQADRPGVILFRGGAYSDREMLALLDRVLARASTLDLEHSIVVDRKRIRRRALPIRQVTGNALDGRKRSLLSHML
jgi:predicted nuclease of predicted toxin-antitoxin system